jgi:hypothetical protein
MCWVLQPKLFRPICCQPTKCVFSALRARHYDEHKDRALLSQHRAMSPYLHHEQRWSPLLALSRRRERCPQLPGQCARPTPHCRRWTCGCRAQDWAWNGGRAGAA